MEKKPLTPRDIAVLAVVVTIFVAVIAGFAWLLADGPLPPALYDCGQNGCLTPGR